MTNQSNGPTPVEQLLSAGASKATAKKARAIALLEAQKAASAGGSGIEDLLPTQVTKAINQLASVLAGRDLAVETNHLSDRPWMRVESMEARAMSDLTTAAQDGDTKALNQAQRKVQSLGSLFTLTEFIRCYTDWDLVGQRRDIDWG